MSVTQASPAPPTGALPPGPRGLPVVGNAPSFRRDRLGFLTRVQRAYGDVATVSFGRFGRFFLLSSAEAVERLLVTRAADYTGHRINRDSMPFLGNGLLNIDGAFHRRQRALVQPAFGRRRVEAYADTMLAYTEDLLSRWRDGQVVEMHEEMQRLTLRIVARALMDLELPDGGDAFGRAFSAIANYGEDSAFMVPTLRVDLPFTAWGRFRRGLAFLDAQIHRLIAERRAAGGDAGDMLSTLIAARDDGPPDAAEPGDMSPTPGGRPQAPGGGPQAPGGASQTTGGGPQAPGGASRTTGGGPQTGRGTGALDDGLVRDHVMTFLAAGHETTSNALTFTLHLLSRNPDKRARLAAELRAVLGARPPAPSDLPALPYLEAVFKESLRLYPPAWVIGRHAVVGDSVLGHPLPAGSVALASQWVVHRLPRYWPQADRFLPERWLPDEGHPVVPYSYFPFGGGPRTCIGMPFALQEAHLILAAVLGRFVADTLPGERLALRPRVTLRPVRGTRMVLRRAG